ncbi:MULTISPECIES: DUF2971 domain-containing protein [Clostridium]|nr:MULTISPECIES: DUF2971 domain-containing protein [Clostridium]UZT07752.1 DUF2971 domain-containing protein [Clostridium sp. LQ25]
MYVKEILDKKLEEYNDFEEFPYCLQFDIISDIKNLYSNADVILRKDAEEILSNCESNLIKLMADTPMNEFWIKCIKIEILAYRLLKIDKCSRNICEHILQCEILDLFSGGKKVERKIFEEMMLLLSEIITDMDNVLYYADTYPYIKDALKLIKYKKLIRNANFKEAYLIYKSIMSDLLINEEKYLKDFEHTISSTDEHNSWIKNKLETFILIAHASNNLNDMGVFFEKVFRENKIKSLTNSDIKEMKIRIDVEKFFSEDINKYTIEQIKEFIRYFKAYNLLDKECNLSQNKNILFLYIQVLMKLSTETYYEEELDYKNFHEKIIQICSKVRGVMDNENYHIIGNTYDTSVFYDIEKTSSLLLCLYKKEVFDDVIKEIKTYKGSDYFLNVVFKSLSLIYFDDNIERDEEKEGIKDVILRVIQLYRDIKYIENLLKVKTYDEKEFAYYTTFQTFSYLLFDEENDKNSGSINKYRLSIMNSGYMNDPNEGTVIYDILRSRGDRVFNIYNILIGNVDKAVRKQYSNSLVFLKSFSNKIDKLTMWSEYGDKGKGCCIVVDGETFRACNIKLSLLNDQCDTFNKNDDEYNLYNVVYWNSFNNNFIVNGKENTEVKRILEKIINNIINISNRYENVEKMLLKDDKIINIIKELLRRICYLIKYDEYQDENEARLIMRRNYEECEDKDVVEIYNDKEKLQSMLYIHYPMKTLIKEVILGPKVVDSDNYAPFIIKKLSSINDKSDYYTKLTNSSIDYR